MSSALYPLASLTQIECTPSTSDGIPADLEEDLRAYGCKLIQQAGILLKQKQVAMSTAQILFQRFWYVSSMKQFGIGDIGMGALYLASKLEECPVRMRDLINVYDLLLQRASHRLSRLSKANVDDHLSSSHPDLGFTYTPMSYFAQSFYAFKDALVVSEMQILKRLGFNTLVALPYGTLVNYLRVLNLIEKEEVSQRSWGYLNDALQTPIYTVYQIPTIVCASIFLTCRHLRISLPTSLPSSSASTSAQVDPVSENVSQPQSRVDSASDVIAWHDLFDASWEDIWSVCGYITRLYRRRSREEEAVTLRLISRKEVRRWLEERGPSPSEG